MKLQTKFNIGDCVAFAGKTGLYVGLVTKIKFEVNNKETNELITFCVGGYNYEEPAKGLYLIELPKELTEAIKNEEVSHA